MDPDVRIAFKVNEDDFDSLMSINCTDCGANEHSYHYSDWFDEDIILENYFRFKLPYTCLFYSQADDNGIVTCAFTGWRPGNVIR